MVALRWTMTILLICGAAVEAARTASVAGDSKPAPESVAQLRERGPDGLKQALRSYDGLREERARLQQEAKNLNGGVEDNTESIAEIDGQIAALAPRIAGWQAAIDDIGG